MHQFQQDNNKYNQENGFSLIEAILASAIVGIGFVGVFTLTVFSERSIQESVAREKLQMQANQILEIIFESDQYNNMDMTSCNAPDENATDTYIIRGYEWCTRLEGEVGSADTNDTRSISVITDAEGNKIVHIELETRNGEVQVVMNRSFGIQ